MEENEIPQHVLKMLDKQVDSNRKEGFVISSRQILYANKDTQTIVYLILIHNGGLANGRSRINYSKDLYVGNSKGYTIADVYHEEGSARIKYGSITEDEENVFIPRTGTRTAHFGIQLDVEGLTVKKSEFKAYGKGASPQKT